MLKALVYGWYGTAIKNIGDSLFCQAFAKLLPGWKLSFSQRITNQLLQDVDYVIFGGGSFLYDPIRTESFELLKTKKILYIGVGGETAVHPMHQELIAKALLVAPRSPPVTNWGVEILEIPDLVYLLKDEALSLNITLNPSSVLVLPNCELIPQHNSPQWQYAAWNYFKSQFSQMLDVLVEDGHPVTFAPLCFNSNMCDTAAIYEIISQMKNRNYYNRLDWCGKFQDFQYITDQISQYQYVISQRFHGAILADLCQRPSLVISHHDKLNNTHNSTTVPYYEASKDRLLRQFNLMKKLQPIPIKLDKFELLRGAISALS